MAVTGGRRALLAIAVAASLAGPLPVVADSGDGGGGTDVDVFSCTRARMDPVLPVLRWLSGCEGRTDVSRGPEHAARSVLSRLAGPLGLDATDTLVHAGNVRTPTGTTVRFSQTRSGVPVYLGAVLVHLSEDGEVRAVNSDIVPDLAVPTSAQVGREAAVQAARRRAPGALRAPLTARLEVLAHRVATPTLAWHVVLPTQAPVGDWHVFVDATSGVTLASWDELRHDTGSGQVYDPNAVQTSGDTSLADSSDETSVALSAARSAVVLGNLDSGTGKLKGSAADLTGPGVTGCNLPYSPGSADESSRNYDYTRDDDRFEEVTAYAALDGAQSWIQSLGFTNVNNRAVPVDVHCTSVDNSFYSSSDKALHFGDGGVDDGEDADVVLHEYGHAIHDDQVPGWGPGVNTEQRAIGEGWGDLLATMFYAFRGDATYQAGRLHCVAEWDAVSYNPVSAGNPGSGCLRWTNGTDEGSGTDIGTYLGVPTQEHNDGRYWSAALTCVFDGMGGSVAARDDVVRLVLAHHFLLQPDLTPLAFEKSVDALLAVDDDLFDGQHATLIANCAEERLGIAAPAADGTPPVVEPVIDPDVPDGSDGWYRSAVNVSWQVSDPDSLVLSEDGCESTTISEDTTGSTLTCTATSPGGTTSKSVTLKRDATSPVLTPVVSPSQVALGGQAEADPGASDATSGVAVSGCDPVDTSSVGPRVVQCTASDVAGNMATATAGYQVVYPFVGFTGLQAPPALNEVPAGRTVQVSFGLGGFHGHDVLADGSPTETAISCTTMAALGAPEPATSPGRTRLHYDHGNERYTYLWNSAKSLPGTCRLLSVVLDDGTTHDVAFRFT